MQTADLDLAYAAGLIDGEGSFVPNARTVRLTVTMTDEKPIAWLHETFGGRRSSSLLPSGKTAWRWSLSDKAKLERFLVHLHPYLKVKAFQADETLAFLAAAPPWKRWDDVAKRAWEDCRKMNHRA